MGHNRNAKPRALRFTWSMKTTSSMEAHLMVQEIIKALNKNHCEFDLRDPFLIFCCYGGQRDARPNRISSMGDGGVQAAAPIAQRCPLQTHLRLEHSLQEYCLKNHKRIEALTRWVTAISTGAQRDTWSRTK